MIASLVNGEPGEQVSLLDRGLQFGDGLFETIALFNGRLLLWERHLDRLMRGCRALNISPPDPALLRAEAERLVDGHARAVLKLTVTRGRSLRGYAPPPDARPTRILALFPWEGPPRRPLSLRICRQRLGQQPGLAGLKHLNRLEQVLARAEFDEGEGLMLDSEGFVVEGTMSNLFLIHEGRLHTPLIDRCGVAGVVRELVIQRAGEMRQPVVLRRILPHELEAAEGLFLTSSLLGVVPAGSFGTRNAFSRVGHHPVLERVAGELFGGG